MNDNNGNDNNNDNNGNNDNDTYKKKDNHHWVKEKVKVLDADIDITKKEISIYIFIIYLYKKGFYLFLESNSIRVIPSGLPSEFKKVIQERKQDIVSFLRSKEKESILSPEVLSETLWLIDLLHVKDLDKSRLTNLLRKARYFNATEDDTMRLSFALIEIYARKVDPNYRATIWGNRTWEECHKSKG